VANWFVRLAVVRGTHLWWPSYNAYLDSPEWAAVRAAALDAAGHLCELCQEAPATQVHHLSYAHAGGERPEELQAVCAPCHEARHPHFPRTFAERWANAGVPPAWERP
jgi:5-methylcytosine-specific restriction endonuclease McrA